MYKKIILILCCITNNAWSMEKSSPKLTKLRKHKIEKFLEKLDKIKPLQGVEHTINGQFINNNESIGSYEIFITQYKAGHYEISYKPSWEKLYNIYNFEVHTEDKQDFSDQLSQDFSTALIKIASQKSK